MARPSLKWRLDGGYSKFLEGSELEVRLADGPFTAALDLFPLAWVKQERPIEFFFKLRETLSGSAGGMLRWKLTPQSEIRALLLFGGNAFLGNFRVPAGHFAVQWDIEATADASVSSDNPVPFLVGLRAGTRLYQSWVSVFSDEISTAAAFKSAWQRYRDPFNPAEVQAIEERAVVRWRWEGHVQVHADFSWGIGSSWSIPGQIPFVDIEKQIAAMAGISASLVAREEGQFSLQLRRHAGQLAFHLVRDHSRRVSGALSLAVQLRDPIRFDHLGFSKPEPLEVVSEGLGQPIVSRLNRITEEALARRLRIGLSVSRAAWRSEKNVLNAVWRTPDHPDFISTYCELLGGRVPVSTPGLRIDSRLEQVKGTTVSIDLTFLDWLKLRDIKQRESKRIVTIGPRGEIVVERCESLQKTSYRWDGIQFLNLVSREIARREGEATSVFWSWALEDEVGQERLRSLLRMALHTGIIRQFSLPPKSLFPVHIRLILGTRFSSQGLEEVKLAGQSQKWKALVRALELTDPDKYASGSFWRDWIDYPNLRSLVDREPARADLATRYPVPGRTDAERTLVVQAYKAVKRFLALLQHWKRDENAFVLRSFDLGIDLPIFVFFHLLCPPELKSSTALMAGDLEQSWGDVRLFEDGV